MTETELKKIFLIITNTYNGFNFDATKFAIWHDFLRDVPFEVAQINLRRHVNRCEFPPTVAELRAPLQPPEHAKIDRDKLETLERIRQLDEWRSTAMLPPPKEAM